MFGFLYAEKVSDFEAEKMIKINSITLII